MILMRKRILIAEDDPSIQKMMKLRLEHEGFTVQVTGDGEEALREAEGGRAPDLVLLDVKMPKMTGYEVCRHLRECRATASVPIIIMSGTESELVHMADRCIEAGANDWIRKPFQTRDLLAKVQALMGKKEGESDGK